MSETPLLLAVPNVSEGRDTAVLETLAETFGPARLLDLHSDPDHGRAVFTLAGRQGQLAEALLCGAKAVIAKPFDLDALLRLVEEWVGKEV